MKKQKGITLISLVVTVIVLTILASIATFSGINVIKSSKLTAFTTELKIMQTRVNEIYEKREEGKTYGEEIAGDSKTRADIVFTANESGITDQQGYRYWSKATIKSLGIEGVEQAFFVNLEKRKIVSYEGIEYEGKNYYTLEQLPKGLYNVEYKEQTAGQPTFDVNVESIGDNKWRVTVSNIQYDGYINKWQVRYQLEGKEYWETTEDLSFVISTQGRYKIQLVNEEVVSEEKEILAIGEYVKEGLQLYYDGIHNTRNGNNPNATSWEDLSGKNNDGIMYNINTNASTVTDSTPGYYSVEENGYVFLQNDSYIKSTNKIGLGGDAIYTIESVSNAWEDGKNPNFVSSVTETVAPAWWGGDTSTVGTSAIFGYNRKDKKQYVTFINHSFQADEEIDALGKTVYQAFRKTKTGEIKTGDTDIGKINNNGRNIPSTYTGTATFTTNLVDSEVQVGRHWQWQNQNRTFYGSIQAIRIYNRALTDEEIQHNYEIDKIRFRIK